MAQERDARGTEPEPVAMNEDFYRVEEAPPAKPSSGQIARQGTVRLAEQNLAADASYRGSQVLPALRSPAR